MAEDKPGMSEVTDIEDHMPEPLRYGNIGEAKQHHPSNRRRPTQPEKPADVIPITRSPKNN